MKENIVLDPKYKDKLDIQFLFNKQIDRCLFYSGTSSFGYHVISLQNLMPQTSSNLLDDQSDLFTDRVPILEFEAPCGIPLGTVKKPCLFDQTVPVNRFEGDIDWSDSNIAGSVNRGKEDYVLEIPILYDTSILIKRLQGDIDWDDPNILSPKKVEADVRINFDKLFKMILSEAENIGILWDLLKETMVIKINPSIPQKNPTPNPNIDPTEKVTIEL